MLREKNTRESDKKESGEKRKLGDGQQRLERKQEGGRRRGRRDLKKKWRERRG